MEFIKYLFSQVEFIAILIISMLAIAWFYVNKNKNIKNPDNENHTDEVSNKTKNKIEDEVDIPKSIVDFIADESIQYEKDKDELTAKLIKNKIEENYEDKGYLDFSTTVPFEEAMNLATMSDASKNIDKLQGEIRNYVERVDEDGKIIFLFDSLSFITKKHKPLIMPDGTIRVQNLLTIEDEILLSIKNKKPLFVFDKENEKIIKITSNEILKILVDNSKEELSSRVISLEKEIEKKNKEIQIAFKENNKLEQMINDGIQREKAFISSLEKIELLSEEIKSIEKESPLKKDFNNEPQRKNKDIENKQTDAKKEILTNIEKSIQEIKKIEDDSFIKVPTYRKKNVLKNNNANKKETAAVDSIHECENERVSPMASDLIQEKNESHVDGMQSTEGMEEKTDTVVEISKEDNKTITLDMDKKETKKLTKRDLKSIRKEFFTEKYLLSDDVLVGNGIPVKERVLIYSLKSKDGYKFIVNKLRILDLLREMLNEEYGDIQNSVEEVYEWFEYKDITDKYFALNNLNTKVYYGILNEIFVDPELMYGRKIVNSFLEPFTQEDAIQNIEISEEPRRSIYEDIVDLFARGKFEKIEK